MFFSGSGVVRATGVVSHKLRNAALARQLWGEDETGATWEYIYFIDSVTERNIPYAKFNAAAGYKPNNVIQGFDVLDERKSNSILSALGIESGTTSSPAARYPDTPTPSVKSVADIRRNVVAFNATSSFGDPARVRTLLTQTTYWVFDAQSRLFAPSKFAGLQDMQLERYQTLQEEARDKGSVSGFDGYSARTAIEGAVGKPFSMSADLPVRLVEWAEELLGEEPFGGVDVAKWQFVSLATPNVHQRKPASTASSNADLTSATKNAAAANAFDPASVQDGREKVMAAITRRRGQPIFRKLLLGAYGGVCSICSCDAEQALEAAHITPYLGPETNHPSNGLLLRADIHTLFDLGLLSIHPHTLEVSIVPQLRVTAYNVYAGRKVRVPDDSAHRPSVKALTQHFLGCGFKL
jgi:hypothetical protein